MESRKAESGKPIKLKVTKDVYSSKNYIVNDLSDQVFMIETKNHRTAAIRGKLSSLFPLVVLMGGFLLMCTTFLGILHAIFGGNMGGNPFLEILVQQPALSFLLLIGLIVGALLVNKFVEPYVFTFQRADGSPAGEIRGKYFHSTWKIKDYSGKTSAALHLRGSDNGELDTPFGLFTVKMEKDVYDSSGNLCFSVNGYNYNATIESKGCLDALFTTLVSICLIERFIIPRYRTVGGQ